MHYELAVPLRANDIVNFTSSLLNRYVNSFLSRNLLDIIKMLISNILTSTKNKLK